MNRCESWTIKKVEHQNIDAFKLWCWIRLLRIPWTARRSNQSILKKLNPEYSLEGLMLKLKRQDFGYLMWRVSSLEKTLMQGKVECKRRWGRQRMRWLDGITDSMDMNLSNINKALFTTAAPWKQPKVSICRRTAKEDVALIHNGILPSHIKEKNKSFVEMWMDLKSVIQSEVRKRKANTVY